MNIQTKIIANLLLATHVIKSSFRIVEKAHIGSISCDNIGFHCLECGKDNEQKTGLQRHNLRFQTLKVEIKLDISNRKHLLENDHKSISSSYL